MVVHKYVCVSLVKPDMPIMHNSTGSTHTQITERSSSDAKRPIAAIEKYAHT